MPICQSTLEDLLQAAFPEAAITVIDQAGDQNHYAVEIVDESFRGKSRVAQQRSVYTALKGKMDGANGELHALAIKTRAPEL